MASEYLMSEKNNFMVLFCPLWSLKATGHSLILYGKEQLGHCSKYLLLCFLKKKKKKGQLG